MEIFTNAAEKRRVKPKQPNSEKLNKARRKHVMCRFEF